MPRVNLPDNIVKRLMLSKYLLMKARDQLNEKQLFAAGIAIGSLQDSIEGLLRVVAEHLHCSVKPQTAFDQLVDLVRDGGKAIGKRISYSTALVQMNKARVNFKHFGLEPRFEDVQKLQGDMEEFYSATVREFLSVDIEAISLVSLIGHRRTENWMSRALQSIEHQAYSDAISATAAAFKIYQNHVPQESEHGGFSGWPRDRDIQHALGEVDRRFRKLEDLVGIFIAGISLPGFRRFTQIVPTVNISLAGTMEVIHRAPPEYNEDDARFCFTFVLESILEMKRNLVPEARRKLKAGSKIRVVKACNTLVWHSADSETVRPVEAGEILLRVEGRSAHDGFVPIIEDGDVLWVPQENIE